MKRILITGLLISSMAIVANSQSKHVLHIMSSAQELREISQEVVKDYLALGAEVQHEMARHEIDEGIALFEDHLFELEDFDKNPQIVEQLEKLEEIWMPMRLILVREPKIEDAPGLIAHSTDLMKEADALLGLIEDDVKFHEAKLVNLAEREAVLSQRIAMLYIGKYWGVNYPTLEKEFNEAKDEFDRDMKELLTATQNTPAIIKQLKRVESEWEFAQEAMHFDSDELEPSIIFVTTHQIMKRMDKVAHLYHDLHLEKHE